MLIPILITIIVIITLGFIHQSDNEPGPIVMSVTAAWLGIFALLTLV